MPTTIIEVTNQAGVSLESASFFGRDCHFPITDLVRRCPPDDVTRNMPTQMGNWEDGTVAPSIIDYEDEIDFSVNDGDECRAAVVAATMQTCELIVPNMACIQLETPQLNWVDLRRRFCKSRNILPNQLCVFDSQGRIDMGQPYTVDFVRFAVTNLSRSMAKMITRNALIGDDANAFEFDGLYTQLENGWNATANVDNPTCGPEFNIATQIDWSALTGDPNGNGLASPEDVTIAGQSINVWGVACDIPAGLNLAEFLEDFWIDKVSTEWADGFGGVSMWEAHVRHGQAKCLINASACMQPCNLEASNILDPGLRERLARLRANNLVELYPSGRMFPMMQSRYVEENSMWFGPREIAGMPTYGAFFEDMDDYLSEVNGQLYGTGRGYFPNPDTLLPVTQDFLNFGFESQAIFWDIFKESAFCMRASMMACMGLLACSRHLWLKVENLHCPDTCITQCDERLTFVLP